MGWTTLSNSNLLDAAERAGFATLITCDQNMVFQQNLATRRIAIVVLMTNRWDDIRAQPQTLQQAVDSTAPGAVVIARFGPRRGLRSPPDPEP